MNDVMWCDKPHYSMKNVYKCHGVWQGAILILVLARGLVQIINDIKDPYTITVSVH